MIRHFGHQGSGSFVVFSAVLLIGAVGCHHRRVQPVLLPAQTAVPTEAVPAPANPLLVEAPKTKLPPVPVAHDESNPKKVKKQRTKGGASSGASSGTTATVPAGSPSSPVTAATPPPAIAKAPEQAAEAAPIVASPASAPAPAPAESIGVFTVGGEQSPRNQQEASELIASNDRRLSGIGADRARTDASLISKVRNFQREAQQALSSGDAEGAKTLATKGKLLLDDMDRGAGTE